MGLLLLATPFISPVPARHSRTHSLPLHALAMSDVKPLLDFSPIAFRPASCSARLAPHATFEPDLYDKL